MNARSTSDGLQRRAEQLPDAVTMQPPTELTVRSAQLFRGGRELVIEHAGARYRLRITRQDKLILTK